MGSAPNGCSMWGQHPILTPNLLKDHSNLSKVIQTRGCLSFMRHRSLSCFNLSVEPGGEASAVGCSVPTCSQKWELSAHTLPLFVHTVSLSCVHTVGLSVQTAGYTAFPPPCCYLWILRDHSYNVLQGVCTGKTPPDPHHFPRPRLKVLTASWLTHPRRGAGGATA